MLRVSNNYNKVDRLNKQRMETKTQYCINGITRLNQVAHYLRSITEVVANPLPVIGPCHAQSCHPQDARNLLLVPTHFLRVVVDMYMGSEAGSVGNFHQHSSG